MHYLSFQFMIIMKYLILFFFCILYSSPCLFPGCDSLLMKLPWGFWKEWVLIFAVCLPVFPIFSNLSLPPGDAWGHHPGWGHHCFQPVVWLHRAPVCTVGSPLTINLVHFFLPRYPICGWGRWSPTLKTLFAASLFSLGSEKPGGNSHSCETGNSG